MRARPLFVIAAASSIVTAAAASAAHAVVYTFQEQTRANLLANPGGSYNVPHGSTYGSTTVAMNNLGEITSKISTVGSTGDQGIFYGPGDGTGGVVAQQDSDLVGFLSDPVIGDSGRIVVSQGFSPQPANDGFWYRDRGAPFGTTFLTQTAGTSASGYRVLPDNKVLSRTSLFGAVGYRSYNPAGGAVQTYVTQNNPGYSFLASAGPADSGKIAGRVFNDNAGVPDANDDQVRLFNTDGSSVLIANEGGTLPGVAGTITSFSNSLSANANGQVAFVATVSGGAGQQVVVSDGTTTRVVANAASPLVSAIDFFAPQINASGQVAFRGKDEAGNDAIFFDDGLGNLTRVIGETDTIQSDLGTAQLGQETTSNPTFSGGVALNDSGQIAFTTGLYPQGNNQVEWGTAIYIATPAVPEPGTIGAVALGGAAMVARRRRVK